MAIPFLNHITLNQNEARDLRLHLIEDQDVTTPVAGQIIYDNGTGENVIKYYNGSSWITLGGDTDNYVDSATLSGTTLTLGRTGTLSDLTVDLSSLDEIVNDNTITLSAGTYLGGGGDFTLNQSTNETITFNHDSTSRTDTTSTDAPAFGATFEAVTSVTTNATGHVTAIDVSTVTIPSSDNTDVDVSVSNLETRLGQIDSDINIGNATGVTVTVRDNLIIDGDLTVSGTTTTVNTETINLADNIITLNSNEAGTPSQNAGIEVERGTADNVALLWNESDDDWEFKAYDHATTPSLTTYKIPRSYSATVGNGTLTTINVDHNLGTRKVIVQLFDSSSYETVYADIVRTTTNRITLTFASAPATNDITVLITTAGA